MSDICEACRLAPVEAIVGDDDPEQPYRVCRACERRLRLYALRPREWFNLASLHGPNAFLLHDDFYDDRGVATQPEEEVEQPENHPAPTLQEAEGSLERLIDYAMTRYYLEPDVVAALARHDRKDILASLQRRVALARSVAIEIAAYEICAQAVGREAQEWIRQRWDRYRPEILIPLAEATAYCLPFEEGFTRVTAALEGMSSSELNTNCFALAYFRSPRTLEWMEAHRHLAQTDSWGRVAALSRLSWQKVREWLDRGRPLSHVALAALQACLRHDTTRITKRYQPVLENPAPVEEMHAALEAYLERDPVPNVRRRVRGIQEGGG